MHFEPYSQLDIRRIVQDRASKALSIEIDPLMMWYCADKSSLEHGDARRALDLFRISAEIAESRREKKITKSHIDEASSRLQEDRIESTLSSASYHLKLACFALAELTFLTGKSWHSTSTLYEQYCKDEQMGVKTLGYRRVSELFTDLKNSGVAESKMSLNGRYGNGAQYRLTYPAESVGKACFPELWRDQVESKRTRIGNNKEDDFDEEEIG